MTKDARRGKRLLPYWTTVALPATGSRPFWQAEPCPVWCDLADGDHHDSDPVEDRVHYSAWYARVPLTLVDVNVTDVAEGRETPEWAEIHVKQHDREIGPRIWLGQSQTNRGWHLTAGEARVIADQLVKAADLAEGLWGGEAA